MDIHFLEETVRFSDTDAAGICYFSRFASFFDEGIINLLRLEGINWGSHLPENLNYLMPVVEQSTKFHQPLESGDKMRIYTAIIELKDKYFKSVHVIIKDIGDQEVKIATGTLSRVTVDYNTFKSKIIPTSLKSVLQDNLVSEKNWIAFLDNYH